MITISLCMIVKDEEEVLGRCLKSVQGIADEIIIVDTGSTDRTKEIAEEFTDRIYDFSWIDDFSAARNFAFSKAEKDYCLWLDADDVIEAEDREAFLRFKLEREADFDVAMMKYHVGFDQSGRPSFSYYRERLMKNNAGFLWEGAVHEAVTPSGVILYLDIAVTHRKVRFEETDRNLRIYERLLAEGRTLSPREQFYFARELMYHKRYLEAAAQLEAFLLGGLGFLENNIEAAKNLSACYLAAGEEQKALAALFRSFAFDAPRAELCCDLGAYFMERGKFLQAVFWYELALSRKRNDQGGGFVLPDCYDYLPAIQLCVLYDRLGDKKKAYAYNVMAGQVKPKDAAYLYNKQYFAECKKEMPDGD